MLEGKDLQAGLDSMVSKGITQANLAFRQLSGKPGSVTVGAFNKLKSLIREERGKYARAKDRSEVEPFLTFLDEIVDRFNLGNETFERDIKNIIDEQRERFNKFLRKLPEEDKKPKNGDSKFEINSTVYEAIVQYEVQQWLTNFPSILLENSSYLFLSKDKLAGQVKVLIKKLEDLVSEIAFLVLEAFPLENREEGFTEGVLNIVTQEILNQILIKIQDIWREMTKELALDDNDFNPIVIIDKFRNKIQWDRIFIMRKDPRIESEEYAQIAEELDCWKEKVEDEISEGLLGKERYEYVLQKREEPFSAFPGEAPPNHLLYPIELELLKRWLEDIIKSKKLVDIKAIKTFMEGEEGELLLIDIADIFNNKLHAGFAVRDGVKDRAALLEIITAYAEPRYPALQESDKDEDEIDKIILNIGSIEDIPELQMASTDKDTSAKASPDDITKESATTTTTTTTTPTPTPAPREPEPLEGVEKEAVPETPKKAKKTRGKAAPLSFDTGLALATLPSLGQLPDTDLTPEERPKHIPEAIFARINKVLRWARNADQSGGASRSINRLIVAKVAIITTHLPALSVDQVLVQLIELEGLEKLLGDDVTISGKSVRFEQWVEIFIEAIGHLDASNIEKNLGNDVMRTLKTLQQKIVDLERGLVGIDALQRRSIEIAEFITSATTRIEAIEREETQITDQHKALSSELLGVLPGSQRFGEIIQLFTDIQRRSVQFQTQKTALISEKSTLEAEDENINLHLSQAEEKRNLLEKLKASQLAAFKQIQDAIQNIETLLENL